MSRYDINTFVQYVRSNRPTLNGVVCPSAVYEQVDGGVVINLQGLDRYIVIGPNCTLEEAISIYKSKVNIPEI